MADQVATVRPNATVANTNFNIVGGAGTVNATLSDGSPDNDATYIQSLGSSTALAKVGFPTASVPSNSIIRYVQCRVRFSITVSGSVGQYYVWCNTSNGTFTGYSGVVSSFTTFSGAQQTINPSTGVAWTVADVNQTSGNVPGVGITNLNSQTTSKFSSAYLDVYYNQGPSISSLTVTNTSLSTPTFTWTYSDPEGDAQQQYHVKVFSAAQTNPDTATGALVDSGDVLSSSNTYTVSSGQALANGSYFVYVKVMDTGSGLWSPWGSGTASSFASFTISMDPPGIPITPAVTPDATNQRMTVVVKGATNQLNETQSSFEISVTGWTAGANTTIAQSATKALDGTKSMQMTPSVAGTISATTPTGTSGIPVTPGQTYTGGMWVQGNIARVSDAQFVAINWYQASGAASGITPTSTGSSGNTNSSVWVQSTVTAAAPSDAAFAALVVTVTNTQGATDVFFCDEAGFAPGISVGWSLGGYLPTQTLTLQRSSDGGVTWTPVRGTPVNAFSDPQTVTVQDYDVVPGASVMYRCSASGVRPSVSQTFTSQYVTGSANTVPTPTNFCLIDPITPADNITSLPVKMDTWKRERMELGQEYSIIGRPHKVFISDTTLQGEDGSFSLEITSAAQMASVKKQVEKQQSLIFLSPYGDFYYIRFVKRPRDTKWTGSYSRPHYIYGALTYIETDAP